MTEISIKKITREMVDQVAQLHMLAFEGYTNTLIGMPYVRAFVRWFSEAEDAIALCAVDSTNVPVGYVVGAPLGYGERLNKKILLPAVGGILVRPWLVFYPRFRGIVTNKIRSIIKGERPKSHQEPVLPGPTISLVGIGVHPDFRGRSIGENLITSFESYVAENQAKSIRLSVYSDNVVACKFYEKAGWQVFDKVDGPFVYYYKIIS